MIISSRTHPAKPFAALQGPVPAWVIVRPVLRHASVVVVADQFLVILDQLANRWL
jgi:hypothetical protein